MKYLFRYYFSEDNTRFYEFEKEFEDPTNELGDYISHLLRDKPSMIIQKIVRNG